MSETIPTCPAAGKTCASWSVCGPLTRCRMPDVPPAADWRPVTAAAPAHGEWVRGRWTAAQADGPVQRGPLGWQTWDSRGQMVRATPPDLWQPVIGPWGPAQDTGVATPAELRTALAHYGEHAHGCKARLEAAKRGAQASKRHGDCTCGLSTLIDGGPANEYVRALVGCNGLGTETPAARRLDHIGDVTDMAAGKQSQLRVNACQTDLRTVLPEGHKLGPAVRLCTSGGASADPGRATGPRPQRSGPGACSRREKRE